MRHAVHYGGGVRCDGKWGKGSSSLERHALSSIQIDVFEDIQRAKALAEKYASSSNSKNPGVQHHFLRELVSSGDISIKWIHAKEHHADVLTKALAREKSKYTVISIGFELVTMADDD